MEIRNNTIVAIGDLNKPGVDVGDLWIVPAFIDSHVHLSLLPATDELARAGVAGVIDMASPRIEQKAMVGRLFIRASGPMITMVRGYPTQGWGRGGYGRESSSKQQAVAICDQLIQGGANLIKIPVGANGLPAAWAQAVITRAHAHKIKVAVHALGSRDAATAADVGADVLAHVPLEQMDERALARWGYRTVITTLAAFGGRRGALGNLQRLRERGATILYGTDLSNSQYPGIHPDEIRLMMAAGMDAAAILESATSAPAEFWGFEHLGALAPGKAASFMLLAEDPGDDPLAFTRQAHVYIDGVRVR